MTARQLRRVAPLWPTPYEPLIAPNTADRSAWQERALCAETDAEAFFPVQGGSSRAAKRTCRACPVTDSCLEYAMDTHQEFGIWGGTSERERRKLRKTWPAPQLAEAS